LCSSVFKRCPELSVAAGEKRTMSLNFLLASRAAPGYKRRTANDFLLP